MTQNTDAQQFAAERAVNPYAKEPGGRPEHAPQPAEPTRPVDDAFAFTTDRIDRAEHMAGNMQGTIQRLARRLEPLLTGGTYGYPDAPGDPMLDGGGTPEDRRSTIAKRITGAGDRVDQLADFLGRLDRELEGLLDAMEV